MNPWGFSRKFLDKLAFSNPNTLEKSKKLRSDFKPIMNGMIERMARKLPALPNWDELNMKLFGNSSKAYNSSLMEGKTKWVNLHKSYVFFSIFPCLFQRLL